MAFKDMEVYLYDGDIKLVYKDKAHRYYAYPRISHDEPVDSKKAWGKLIYPKGTTTLLGDTLEKKGLMTWPMGMALQELFGFYNFKTQDENGQEVKRLGFSKDKGTLWDSVDTDRQTTIHSEESLLPIVRSASENYLRRQKKGADIGSVVHDAIEHFVLKNPNKLVHKMVDVEVFETDEEGNYIPDVNGVDGKKVTTAKEWAKDEDDEYIMEYLPIEPSGFDIAENYMWNIKEAEYETEADFDKAMEDFPEDVKMAQMAFDRFVIWWTEERPELLAAEQLVYSRQHNISGTFDALIRWKGKVYLTDWKTSNASTSKEAAMPEGINYQYFIQDAIYAIALEEEGSLLAQLGVEQIDGLAVVSCRKDGGFTALTNEDLELTIEDCEDWAASVAFAYRMMEKTKKGLIAHAEGVENGSI